VACRRFAAAASQPPHLAAICAWEGWNDAYRESHRHGGIACTFRKNWQEMQVKTVQHGIGERGKKHPITGELACGPETLSEAELANNREDMWLAVLERETDSEWYRERSADLSRVTVPVLSAANWGGQGLQTRGNFEGYAGAASKQKWLEVHGGSHWAPFYTGYGVGLQKRFFDHFLKGAANGWDQQPKVLLQVRYPREKFVERAGNEWPIARTRWTHCYLDPAGMRLSDRTPAADAMLTYDATGEGATFSTGALEHATEITAARSRSSCSCLRRPWTPIFLPSCGCSIRTARSWCSRGRLIRTRPSPRAGCALPTASSTRSARCPTGLITPMMKSSR